MELIYYSSMGSCIMYDVVIFIVFVAGFLFFISPCVLPLFPAFLLYITGMSVNELNKDNTKLSKRAMLHTILFLLGCSSVFILLGFIAMLISYFFMMYHDIFLHFGSFLIIFC